MWFNKRKNEEEVLFEFQSHQLEDGRVTKYFIFQNKKQLSFSEILEKWSSSEIFRIFYNNVLAGSKYEGFFWETPPQTKLTINEPFEFVLVRSKRLPSNSHFSTKLC